MHNGASCGRLLLAAAVLSLAGCAGKSPQEVEAERAKANAEWNADVERAERARQREEQRLVAEELAAHQRATAGDDEQARKAADAEARVEQERLLQLVRAKATSPQSASFDNVHWNATRSALCGEVQGMHFIASGDQATVDSSDEAAHADFTAAAEALGCLP